MQLKVTCNTTAVPGQTKASAVLVSLWSTSQSTQGALLPGCAGAVHSVCSLPSDNVVCNKFFSLVFSICFQTSSLCHCSLVKTF